MFQEVSTTQFDAKQNVSENLKYFKIHTSILQEEILTLKSQLDIKQNKLKDVKVFTNLQEECAKLKSQLQSQVKYSEKLKGHANLLKEENSKLATQSRVRGKILQDIEDLKVHTNILQEENSELKAQLKLTEQQLKNSELEKEQYINKHSQLEHKERCDIAIQADMVCTYVAATYNLVCDQ